MAEYLCSDINLEQIDSFFSLEGPSSDPNNRVKAVPKSSTKLASLRNPRPQPPQFVPSYKRNASNNPDNASYAAHYQELEEETAKRTTVSCLPDDDSASALAGPTRGGMEDLEYSSCGYSLAGDPDQDASALYSNYRMDHTYNPNLPITKHREEIINLIESNQVTVVEGPTGCGKTTQVPQYILDHYASLGRYCNIIVTQPRRIAAMSIARRVCSERDWTVRGFCGYQIGLDRQASEDTRLLFVTTQVLLRKLIGAKSMATYTHIILDEVHERDQYSDFCLLVVRKFLRTNSRNVKVILMSATIETNLFATYFKVPVRNEMQPAPIFTVEGGTFQVSEYYVEDLKDLGDVPALAVDEPMITMTSFELAKKLILYFDEYERKQQGLSSTGFAAKRGSVLVFLPGLAEISNFDDLLQKHRNEHRLTVLPLHSTITGDEQARVFDAPSVAHRKVILATNIAESSITVTDIKYVIDFCLTKNLTADNETYTSLQVEWASKSNCIQRKGRAGRVSNGRVYRMITRQFWAEYLPEHGIPEMQRCPLENLVLETKLLNLGEPKAILGLALSPPNLEDIEKTILLLKEVGALRTAVASEYNPHDGDLTFMGRVLAGLPVDIHVGKLLMLGYTFGFLEDCIVIGAMLSLKSVFATPFKARLDAYKTKLTWTSGAKSDCFAMLNAYKLWEKKTKLGAFASRRDEIRWTSTNMVQHRRLHDVRELVDELSRRLSHFNIVPPRGPPRRSDVNEDLIILKVIIAGAFYPNYFFRVPGDEEQSIRLLAGHNPFTTVMVKNVPIKQGPLYREAIQRLFQPCPDRCRVHFEDTRAYIEFNKSPGLRAREFSLSVYLALKMKQLRLPLFIYPLSKDEAHRAMEGLNASHTSGGQFPRSNRVSQFGGMVDMRSIYQIALPDNSIQIIQLNITELIECGRFWAHYGDDETWEALHLQQSAINQYDGQALKPLSEAPVAGMFVLAFFQVDGNYYRARVDHIDKTRNPVHVNVFFVDYGNVDSVPLNCLRRLEPHMKRLKFQAFECELAEIKPCTQRCPGGRWTEDAKEEMANLIAQSSKAFGQVYSVVHGVVRLELQIMLGGRTLGVNKHLVDKGFASQAEESFVSRQDHADRGDARLVTLAKSSIDAESNLYLSEKLLNIPAAEPAPDTRGNEHPPGARPANKYGALANRVLLHGPSSPFEVMFSAATASGRMKTVSVERDSVNSIVLDEDPEVPYQQLMVAANVTVNPAGDKIQARDTTILPHTPGLPELITLLFTPHTEFRVSKDRTHYTGALCGLGWDPYTDGPAFPDHDIELTFDCYIDNLDIEMVNKVRHEINIAIGSGDSITEWGPDGMLKIQKKIRQRLLELLNKKRIARTPTYYPYPHVWRQATGGQSSYASEDQEDFMLLNYHDLEELVPSVDPEVPDNWLDKRKDEKREMLKHIDWLHSKASSDNFGTDPVTCILCTYKMESPYQLKIHLAGRMHKEQETKYLI